MQESNDLSPDAFATLLDEGAHDELVARLERLTAADTETRKMALRTVREHAETRPTVVGALSSPLTAFLTDDQQAVRLLTAKLFVTIAETNPDALCSAIPSLAERVADGDEFYYVRARSAEALGYVALEHPDEVATPELLADLRIGLSFDRTETKQKLAKALAHIALGDPDRLRHHLSDLADNLGDADELVRYHLCTALVGVGCEHPESLLDVTDELSVGLDDDSAYVRGRAAEAIGLVARTADPPELPTAQLTSIVDEDADEFAVRRAQFALGACETESEAPADEAIGALESIREQTDDIVADLTALDGDECMHCGNTLPETGPPLCPHCGAPR